MIARRAVVRSRSRRLRADPPISVQSMSGRIDIGFPSAGTTLRGWLYESGETPSPGIVMAHGLSAVKEMYLDDYASAFAEAGFTTLAYDHFGFGASDGDPRQSPSPQVQQLGYRDAVTWLATHPSVDSSRIGIWGPASREVTSSRSVPMIYLWSPVWHRFPSSLKVVPSHPPR